MIIIDSSSSSSLRLRSAAPARVQSGLGRQQLRRAQEGPRGPTSRTLSKQ